MAPLPESELVDLPAATVPIGPATLAGYGGALASFALGVVGYIAGDRSSETVSAIAGGIVLAAVTGWGRMAQARALLASKIPTALEPLAQRFTGNVELSRDELTALIEAALHGHGTRPAPTPPAPGTTYQPEEG